MAQALRLIWFDETLEDIDEIAEYISRDSPYYAQRVVEELIAGEKGQFSHCCICPRTIRPMESAVIGNLPIAICSGCIGGNHRSVVSRISAVRPPIYASGLTVNATLPDLDIRLGDDEGHLVQKETGTQGTSVMEWHYTVEFGLGNTTYPIHLTADARYTEEQIRPGPSCPQPIPNIKPPPSE